MNSTCVIQKVPRIGVTAKKECGHGSNSAEGSSQSAQLPLCQCQLPVTVGRHLQSYLWITYSADSRHQPMMQPSGSGALMVDQTSPDFRSRLTTRV